LGDAASFRLDFFDSRQLGNTEGTVYVAYPEIVAEAFVAEPAAGFCSSLIAE